MGMMGVGQLDMNLLVRFEDCFGVMGMQLRGTLDCE